MSIPGTKRWADTWADVRRSFSDFLAVPVMTVLGFLLLAYGTYVLDRNVASWLEPTRDLLKRHLLASDATTLTLLGTIAGGMITVTSITFSLLLLAVQQSASSLTTQVLDQFLRRRLNQFYFAVFVGVALYSLAVLATNNTRVTPVFGTLIALVLTFGALSVLLLLLYTTLNQMRANRIVEAIHDLTLDARRHQHELLRQTRRTSRGDTAAVTLHAHSDNNGYVAAIDVQRIGAATRAVGAPAEVVLLQTLGDYVCYQDRLAEVRAQTVDDARIIEAAVQRAFRLERQRNLDTDAGYGVTQLATIGWTSTSSAKSNPSPALATLRNLRDLLARWIEDSPFDDSATALPIVYRDDVLEEIIDAFESIGVAASESRQHRCCAEILNTFALMFERLPPALQPRMEDAARRLLTSLGDHVPTADIEEALGRLTATLAAAGRFETAAALRAARGQLTRSIGEFGSSSARMSSHG